MSIQPLRDDAMTIAATLRRAAGLILAAGLIGCGNGGPPGAGLTNGPPPADDAKAAGRSDLPTAAVPDQGEALGKAGDNDTNAGTGGRSPSQGAGDPVLPKAGSADDSVRANPPKIESSSPSSAAGGTKPAGNINTGTPRSPN